MSSELTKLKVEGMTCSNCAAGISKYLNQNGLKNVYTDFASGEVSFEKVSDQKLEDTVTGIRKLGYDVIDKKDQAALQNGLSPLEKKFWVSVIFTIPLILHMFISSPWLHNTYFQLALCLPVFIIGLLHFGKSALAGLRSGIANMDVLIMIGSSAAFFYSLTGTILYGNSPEVHGFLFYETSATIITLVLLGNLIEHRSIRATTSAIDELNKIKVESVNKVIYHDGHEHIENVPIEFVQVSDLLLVNAGDKIPVDAIIQKGSSSIDESMISGESLPVFKNSGDKVMAGTINLDSSLYIKTAEIGEGTVLSKIIEMVKRAQRNKPGIQKIGDKVSSIFVPVVLSISALTFIISYFFTSMSVQTALMNSIAVLVISCPCAMGLATPTAVMAGIGRAARNGILIKGGDTIEKLASADIMIFDKTGTLTTGDLSVSNFNIVNASEQDVIDIIYALEIKSAHPIARSVVKFLKDKARHILLNNVSEVKGNGIQGQTADGSLYKLGSARFCEITGDNDFDLYLTKNNQLIASLNITDDLRPGVHETIIALKEAGVRPILLSGDTRKKCEAIAKQVGIEEVYCEQLPEQKLLIVEKLSNNFKVAMVGDGINDAPALARAHVGISLSNSTDVAINAAEVVIIKTTDFTIIAKAVAITRKTLTTIKQNLFWAFLYNVFAIPLAAFGYLGEYGPMIGAFSMAMSDVVVIGNSILLKYKKLAAWA